MNEELIVRLLTCRRRRPFVGQAPGGIKKSVPCPHCGSRQYGFRGRWKYCESCGYDRHEEYLFNFILGEVKRHHPVDFQSLQRCLEYFASVYDRAQSTAC